MRLAVPALVLRRAALLTVAAKQRFAFFAATLDDRTFRAAGGDHGVATVGSWAIPEFWERAK